MKSNRQITPEGLEDVERRARMVIERNRGILRFINPEATQAAATLVMVDEIRRLWSKEEEKEEEGEH